MNFSKLKEIGGLLASVFLMDGVKSRSEIVKMLGEVSALLKDATPDEIVTFTDWAKDVLLLRVPQSERSKAVEFLGKLDTGGEGVTYAIERVLDREAEENRQKGRKEGIQEGIQEGMKIVAGILLKKGTDIFEVQEITALPMPTLEELRQSLTPRTN